MVAEAVDAEDDGTLDVFISYSPLDRALAASARRALGSYGVTAWVHPAEGESEAEVAMSALSRAHVMVLIFSEHANTCSRVRREAERAVAHNLPIIPFRISDVPLSPSMEYFISATHWFDALDGPPYAHLDRLCDSVRRLLLAAQQSRQAQTAEQSAREAHLPWTPADLERLERMLATYLGPVARILVREALPLSNSNADLSRRLARQIDREGERQSFLAACRSAGYITDPAPAVRHAVPAPLLPAAKPGAHKKWPWARGRGASEEVEARPSLEERMVDPDFTEGASLLLARHVGPVARVLAARAARDSVNAQEMVRALAESIPSEREKKEFLRAAELL